jgi:hypothetical protein
MQVGKISLKIFFLISLELNPEHSFSQLEFAKVPQSVLNWWFSIFWEMETIIVLTSYGFSVDGGLFIV